MRAVTGVVGASLVLFLAVLALPAAAAPDWSFLTPGLRAHPVASPPGIVALTFDDGPDATTLRIARYLHQENIPATFFLVGTRVRAHPEIVRELAAMGFELGNHSATHRDLARAGAGGAGAEIAQCSEAIAAACGHHPRYFRPPYGSFNRTVTALAAEAGMTTVLWSVDPFDWTEPGVDTIVRRAVSLSRPGSVILLHSNHAQTADALPGIVSGLRAKGYRFVSLDEWFSSMLGIEPAIPQPLEPRQPPVPTVVPPELEPAATAAAEMVEYTGSAEEEEPGTQARAVAAGLYVFSEPGWEFKVFSNVRDAREMSAGAGADFGGRAASPASSVPGLSWRDELLARTVPRYRSGFLLNRRSFAPAFYPQPVFYFLVATEEVAELDQGFLRDLAAQAGISSMLLLRPAAGEPGEVGDFGIPAQFVSLNEFDPTAVFDLQHDRIADLLALYRQKKEAVFVLVSSECFRGTARANLENAAVALMRFRQLTADRVYDPAEELAGDWLPEGVALGRFTGGGRTLFVLTAEGTQAVRLPSALRRAGLVTLEPGCAAYTVPLRDSQLSVSADAVYLLTG